MKKSVFFVAAVALFASCAQNEVEYLADGAQNEIALSVINKKAGNAKNVTINQIYSGIDFTVWANYSGDVEPSTDIDTADFKTAYIAKADFTKQTDYPTFGGKAHPYYWPKNGSLIFAGISPAVGSIATAAADGIDYSFEKDSLGMASYTQPAPSADNVFDDVLYFSYTKDSYNTQKTELAVPVTFQHTQAWLTFQVVGDSAVDAANYRIDKIVVNNVKKNADLIAKTDTVKWTLEDAASDVIVFDSLDFGARVVVPGKKAYDTIPAVCETYANSVIAIPQKATTATVTFTWTTPAGEQITETIDGLDLDPSAKQTEEKNTPKFWLAGKHYYYTLVFNLESHEIRINPAVEAWENVVVEPVIFVEK